MYYYQYKKIIKENTTLQIIIPENVKSYQYDEINGITYIGCSQKLNSDEQHIECEVKEIEYAKIKPILENCYLMKNINETIINDIRKKYSIDDEFNLIKKAMINKNDIEYLEMQKYINYIKNLHKTTKIEIGLI